MPRININQRTFIIDMFFKYNKNLSNIQLYSLPQRTTDELLNAIKEIEGTRF